jgi:uncharacterized membrane protein
MDAVRVILHCCQPQASITRYESFDMLLLSYRADIEVAVPLEVCWSLWEDRERIPLWMPWFCIVANHDQW